MPLKKNANKGKLMTGAALLLIGLMVVLGIFLSGKKNSRDRVFTPAKPLSAAVTRNEDVFKPDRGPGIVTGKIQMEPAIDFQQLDKDPTLDELMARRKQKLGIKNSLDMIVRSNENFVVGNKRISMQEILEKAYAQRGKIFQTQINETGKSDHGPLKEYGIYVVRPGDNIWNIHFNILKDYYTSKGVDVPPEADEPTRSGSSSGVGKILKFSETMVIIYSIIDQKVVKHIDTLQPLTKVIVYNMSEVFSLLKAVNYDHVNQIQFDGKNIWIPVKKT